MSSALALADEIADISLITPLSYMRPTSTSQSIKSKIQVGLGDLFNADISERVKSKMEPYKIDLALYFKKSGELDAFVDNVVKEGKETIIGTSLTDEKLIKFNGFLGRKLVGEIATRILKEEGIKDPARRELWKNKILAPFNECIGRAKNSQYDAGHCMDALTTSLVPSTGIGIVYELSRSSLSNSLPEGQRSEFNHNQVETYKACIQKKPDLSATDVKTCALDSMRSGVLKITDSKLTKTINEAASSSGASKAIKQKVWPDFTDCTQKVGTKKSTGLGLSDQFLNCIDSLVQATGVQLVQDKVNTNKSILANFSKAEITKLSTEKANDFSDCMDKQKENNIRKGGMLDTSKCENIITNDITYKVVVKTLAQTAKDAFKDDSSHASFFTQTGKELLDKCWSNDLEASGRERCLRKTTIEFAHNIAQIKLEKAIPDTMKSKKELKNLALSQFQGCLDKQLPESISTANDLDKKTEFCSKSLTRTVAYEVAKDSILTKANDSKMGTEASNGLIKTLVDDHFIKCLGALPSDDQVQQCSNTLKKEAAINLASFQIRTSAQGKMDPSETNELINRLVTQNFSNCLGSAPSDEQLNKCIGTLTQGATKEIVLSYEKKQIKEQLNADFTPSKLKPVEADFISCVDRASTSSDMAKELDECTKQFALNFAKVLGELKMTTLMKSVLGSAEYNSHKPQLDEMIGKYNECLDGLKSFQIQDGLLDKLTQCTDALQHRGVNFISGTVNSWMSSEQKDASTLMVKNEFAKILPCLGQLLPASPYSQRLQTNVDSMLKPVAMLMAQYIEYSPENAKQSLDQVIKKLSTDLKDVATNPASKKALIDTLYSNGALDQFLKSMIRGQVKDSLNQISEEDLPADLRNILLEKNTFDKIFASQEGAAIKDLVMEKILKPVLMEQASMKSPVMVEGMKLVQDKVVKLLVNSPDFGDQIIKKGIQNKIKSMNGFSKVLAKVFYGGDSLNWDKVRLTNNGEIAEKYIRENILMPKFKGEAISKEEEKKLNDEAERLVKEAVKNYK